MYSFKVSKDARKGFLVKDMIEGLNSYKAIQEYATRLGVVIPIDEEKVETILTLGLTEENDVIVEAKPPKNGRDSELKFKVNVSSKATFIPDNKDDKVDYKNAMRHESVAVGDLVAVHLAETEGKAGEDLWGKPIPSIPGKSIVVKIGEGIEREKNLFFATKNGVPSFKKGVLSIEDLLVLDDGVNLKSGNVKSQFSVDIYGDVEEGFEIESDGDVRVFGAFYGKKIKAKGNVEIRHGINGKGKSEIIAEGRILAMFVNQATLKAREEIMVTKNIHHSKLSSLDSIQCQGSVIGGVTEALNYVEVLSVGSELAGLTRVKIGFHYELESLLTLKKTFYGQIEQIQKRYFEAIENGKLESRLRPSLEADINLVKKNKEIIRSVEDKIVALEKDLKNSQAPSMKVNYAIYPDFELRANGCFFELKEEYKGAIKLVLNRERGCIDKFK